MKKIAYFIFIVCLSCKTSDPTVKIQTNRDNVMLVKDYLREITIEEPLFSNHCRVYILDDYLIVADYKSYDNQISIFDKHNFSFLASTAPLGQGPAEIVRMSSICVDEGNRRFFVSDSGKNKIFCYNLDSVLANPTYMPESKMIYQEREIPSDYEYINDSLFIGIIMKPTGNIGHNEETAKINTITGEIITLENLHPEIVRRRTTMAVSVKHDLLIECYNHHDLFSIRTLAGDLKHDIYGKHWDSKMSNRMDYFFRPIFCKEKIAISYLGERGMIRDKNGQPKVNLEKEMVFFDLDGDYIKTLDLDHPISSYCYDETYNRIIFFFRDEMQLAYLELDGLID